MSEAYKTDLTTNKSVLVTDKVLLDRLNYTKASLSLL